MEENPELIVVRDGRCLMIGTRGLSLQEVYLADLTREMISARRWPYFTGDSLEGCAVSMPEAFSLKGQWGLKAELKLHCVETRLRLFKGENHELSRKGRPRNWAGSCRGGWAAVRSRGEMKQ